MHKTTREERFLIALYDLAAASGDRYNPVMIGAAGRAVGIVQLKTVVTMVKGLVRGNFLRRIGKDEIHLTSFGAKFVEDLAE